MIGVIINKDLFLFFCTMKKMLKEKTPQESEVIMTEIVFPNDTNPLGILRGGKILDWMDTASAICAQTHTDKIAVTASIDLVSFKQPVKLGDIITIRAKITKAFRTSMEIAVEVMARRIPGEVSFISNQALYTFVALDENAIPTTIPGIKPTTVDEKSNYNEAQKRYDLRDKSKQRL